MQRDAIMLTAFDGRSHEEIALELGVTHGAVRGLLYRARATLRDAAAAVLPQPLLLWASGLLAKMTPGAAKVAELSAPAGNTDFGGVLAKGAALAATAAVLAVGTGVVPLPRHLAHRSKAAAQALGIAPATAEAQTSASSVSAAGVLRERSGSGSADSSRIPRPASSRRTAPAPAQRRRSDGTGHSHDGSGDGLKHSSPDSALNRDGEADLSGGRSPQPGSDAQRAPDTTSTDSSHGGRSAPECDHCSQRSVPRDETSPRSDVEPSAPLAGEAIAPSASPEDASAITPTRSRQAPAERHPRD
jgi:hypothetical protein